ncbi:MAG TPA: hypothetical protein VNJ07_00280, partial [Chitinophagales bacterium]|nr:hypothetical protein [Chitinophagales bacterium]
KVVLVIRREFLNEFEKKLSYASKRMKIDFAFQDVNPKFEGIENIATRQKPWGTVHAVLSASQLIREPFAVINADDFYGKESFRLMAEFLKHCCTESHWAMIAYQLKNTLSTHGGVTRGVCRLDENGFLKNVKECRSLQKSTTGIFYIEEGKKISADANSLVSMNFWGFHPYFFELAEKEFRKFVVRHTTNPKAEMVIADAVNPLMETDGIRVSVLNTAGPWFGVTYQGDKENVINNLKKLASDGNYSV